MMDQIKTILVDDEPRGLSSLQRLLDYNCPELKVVATCSSADDAKKEIELLQPQLVFLDIAMPGKTGFDMLAEMKNIRFEIIFVTAHNNFMLQAFRFSATDYLLKPVEDNLLVEAVKRATAKIEKQNPGNHIDTLLHNLRNEDGAQKMKICIPSLKGFQVVKLSDIVYCEASSNYTNFHLTGGAAICASRPIHEFETILDDSGFIRIHKSFLVNLEHVKEYIRGEGGMVVLSNGHDVEVSRRKKELFLNRMKGFYKY